MTTGVVLSVDVERYGDTLAVATAATDVVLQVEDIVDFADEDDFAAGPQWLKVGESAPMQYVSVDDDADTVTLAAPVGAVYEAGEPVRMWDPTIGDAGGEVVGYLCWVELDEADDDDAPIPAEVRHERMVYFGVNNLAGLIGARVSLEVDDDDPEAWHVAEVIGREAVLNPGAIATPHISLYRPSNLSVSHDTMTDISGYSIKSNVGNWAVFSGAVRVSQTGKYLVTGTVMFAANSTGRRTARIERINWDSTETEERVVAVSPVTDGTRTAVQVVTTLHLWEGQQVRLVAYQNSGAALNLLGYADGTGTALEVTWVGP